MKGLDALNRFLLILCSIILTFTIICNSTLRIIASAVTLIIATIMIIRLHFKSESETKAENMKYLIIKRKYTDKLIRLCENMYKHIIGKRNNEIQADTRDAMRHEYHVIKVKCDICGNIDKFHYKSKVGVCTKCGKIHLLPQYEEMPEDKLYKKKETIYNCVVYGLIFINFVLLSCILRLNLFKYIRDIDLRVTIIVTFVVINILALVVINILEIMWKGKEQGNKHER